MVVSEIEPSLNIFLKYDFAKSTAQQMSLDVGITPNGHKFLITYSKSREGGEFDREDIKSLKKVVKFVIERQEMWYNESLKNEAQKRTDLEFQIAWLERRVKECNNQKLKKKINYKAFAHWSLTIKFLFTRAFTSSQKKNIITENLEKIFTFNRLTTKGEVYEKCNKIRNTSFLLKLKCIKNNCQESHEVHAKLSKIFKGLTIKNHGLQKDSDELFMAADEEGRDKMIIFEPEHGNSEFLRILLEACHDLKKSSSITKIALFSPTSPQIAEPID